MTDPFGTEPMIADDEPAAAAPAEAPKRKRGRPSNAERAAAATSSGRTAPAPGRRTARSTAARRTADQYAKGADDVLGLIQTVVAMKDEVAAEILADGRPRLAQAAGKFAAGNDLVGAWLDRLSTSSDAVDLVVAAGVIAVPMLAHFGLLNATPLRDAAVPYEERVAQRRATAEEYRAAREAAEAQAA